MLRSNSNDFFAMIKLKRQNKIFKISLVAPLEVHHVEALFVVPGAEDLTQRGLLFGLQHQLREGALLGPGRVPVRAGVQLVVQEEYEQDEQTLRRISGKYIYLLSFSPFSNPVP